MNTINIKVKVTNHRGSPRPDVRIYLDLNGDGEMSDREEVTLTKAAKSNSWTGTASTRRKRTVNLRILTVYDVERGATLKVKATTSATGGKSEVYVLDYNVKKRRRGAIIGHFWQ